MTSFVALGMRSEGNAPKNGEPIVCFSFGQRSSTPVGCGQGFLRTEQRDNTGASPMLWWPGYTWFLSIPSTEISTEGTALLWRYWHNYECDGRAEKVFIKWLPGMFPIRLQSLSEVYKCTRGLFWRKYILNYCNVLYFSEIKWFREYFGATMYKLSLRPINRQALTCWT